MIASQTLRQTPAVPQTSAAPALDAPGATAPRALSLPRRQRAVSRPAVRHGAALVAGEAQRAEDPHAEDLRDLLPDPYFLTDVAGRVQVANRASAMVLGYAPRYILAKPLAVMLAVEHRSAFTARLTELATLPGAWQREWEAAVRPRQGTRDAVVAFRVAPHRDGAGRLTGFHWFLQDRTALHQAAAEATAREQSWREHCAQLEATLRLQAALLAAPVSPVSNRSDV